MVSNYKMFVFHFSVIFLLYANEAGTHVQKNYMVRLVQETEGGYIPEAVADCFLEVNSFIKTFFIFCLVNLRSLTTNNSTCHFRGIQFVTRTLLFGF